MGKKKNKQPKLKALPSATPFSEKKQKQYERMARLQYGPELVNESVKRWNSYSKAQQQAIQDEGGRTYAEITRALEAGLPPDDADVQALVEQWHEHIYHFYTPTTEIMRGLGERYRDDPEFAAFFKKFHPELPEYLAQAITHYVDVLEDAELARLMAEDEKQSVL